MIHAILNTDTLYVTFNDETDMVQIDNRNFVQTIPLTQLTQIVDSSLLYFRPLENAPTIEIDEGVVKTLTEIMNEEEELETKYDDNDF